MLLIQGTRVQCLVKEVPHALQPKKTKGTWKPLVNKVTETETSRRETGFGELHRLGLNAGAPGQGCSECIHLYSCRSLRLECSLPCSHFHSLRNAFPDCPFSSYNTHTITAHASLAEINKHLGFCNPVYFLFFFFCHHQDSQDGTFCIAASLAPSPTEDKFEE